MPERRQFVRGPAAQADLFLGLPGEIYINESTRAVRVHDGQKTGGYEQSLVDASNMQPATNAQDGKMTQALVQDLEQAQTDITDVQTAVDGESLIYITGEGPTVLTDAEAKARIITIYNNATTPPTADPYTIEIPGINSVFAVYNHSSVSLQVKSVASNQVSINPGTKDLVVISRNQGDTNDFRATGSLRSGQIRYDNDTTPPIPDVLQNGNEKVSLAIKNTWLDLDARTAANLAAIESNDADIAALQADIANRLLNTNNLSDIDNRTESRKNLRTPFGTQGFIHFWPFNFIPNADWFICDGSTIGSAASLANYRYDELTNLYQRLWDNFPDSECPVIGGRGASAVADFNANKPMGLLDLRNVMPFGANDPGLPNGAKAGTERLIGSRGGAETHTLVDAELPLTQLKITGRQTSTNNQGNAPAGTSGTGISDWDLPTFGGDQPHSIMNPYFAMNYVIFGSYIANIVRNP